MTNSFSQPVETAYPRVAVVRKRLAAAGAECAMLSGSGSCLFGFFADAGSAKKCADELSASGYWTYSTEMVHYVARTDCDQSTEACE
jgi:4-diphosphocytidyl-2C-methyl-D-erythritol kinase